MKASISFSCLFLCLLSFGFGSEAHPAHYPYPISQGQTQPAWENPASPVAASDTADLNVLVTEINQFAEKSLRNYIISSVMSLGGFAVLLMAASGASMGLFIFATLIMLASSGVYLASFIQLLKGRSRLDELDDRLLALNNNKQKLRYRARVSRPRTILKALLILNIVGAVLGFFSTLLSSAA